MHPADIKAAIEKAGLTQRAIAKEYGCGAYNVSNIINSGYGSEPLMKFIAAKIGKKPEEVFPAFFNLPNRRTRKDLWVGLRANNKAA